MFERAHHRSVALILQSLDAGALAARGCWFGGGTAMALRYGEYRESVDIDFLISDLAGYRDLRQMLGGRDGLKQLCRQGLELQLAREVTTDQYGIRTVVRAGPDLVKFEIVLEGRIELAQPVEGDRIAGVLGLAERDLATEKLLALADRWRDDAVFSRDLIDLAMQPIDRRALLAACTKAEAPYGASVRRAVAAAVADLRARRGRLRTCMEQLRMDRTSDAQLWTHIRRVARRLPIPPAADGLHPGTTGRG